jgi:DNA-directed RNA polymerase specialized sigma24 family protein
MRKICPAAIQYIGELYVAGTLAGCSDGQLLERFIATDGEKDRTDAELAFACLLERHGGMVWNVCRSFAVDDHDAEDAFQATFLVLVRKAPSLRVRQTLGPWLYAVAHRVGMSARTALARRRAVERTAWNRALKDGRSRPSERLSEMEELVGLLHLEQETGIGPLAQPISGD